MLNRLLQMKQAIFSNVLIIYCFVVFFCRRRSRSIQDSAAQSKLRSSV